MYDKDISLNSQVAPYNPTVNFYYGKVVENVDPTGTKRLKVRIKGVDDKTTDDLLPWCISFLPLNITTSPKIGEMVKIFFQNTEDINNKREWLGPVISNYSKLDYESYNNALNNTQLSNKELPIKNNNQVYDQDNFVLNGRENVDIIFKPSELLIRAGKFSVDDLNQLNESTMSSFRLKMSSDGSTSDATIFSDKILLISNEGKYKFNKVITDSEVQTILNNAYSATYAEPLIEFLKLVQDFVVNHVHANNLPPNSGVGSIMNITDFDLDTLIAKNIKIN